MSVLRCSIAAIGVSVLQYLLEGLGPGWTFTIFGALCVATVPLLLAVRVWGMHWRTMAEDRRKQHQTEPESVEKDVDLELVEQEKKVEHT